MSKKNVMIITNNGGGLYSFRYELICALRQKKYEVILVYPGEERQPEFKSIGCICIDLMFDSASTNPIGDIRLYRSLKKLIKRYKPSIGILYTIKPCIYGGKIFKNLKIPFITTVTGISPALISDNPLIRLITTFLCRIGYNAARTVYFQNSMNEELYTKLKISTGKHVLINGSGVNIKKFSFLDYPKDDGTIKVLYVGRLKRIKGVDELASAVKRAINEGINIVCKVIGEEGDQLPQFNNCVEEGIIQYEGPKDNVIDYLKWCDVLVLPSYGEGMSNVLQEASACGRPVLASDIPGCREIFEEGITGYGFKPKDDNSIFEALARFSKIPYQQRKNMGKLAREKMEREFDRDRIVKIYVDRIEELVGELE